MSKIQIDTWYDVTCHCCARSRSSDFEKGMATSKTVLSKLAYREGWKSRNGVTLCPDCSLKDFERMKYVEGNAYIAGSTERPEAPERNL